MRNGDYAITPLVRKPGVEFWVDAEFGDNYAYFVLENRQEIVDLISDLKEARDRTWPKNTGSE